MRLPALTAPNFDALVETASTHPVAAIRDLCDDIVLNGSGHALHDTRKHQPPVGTQELQDYLIALPKLHRSGILCVSPRR